MVITSNSLFAWFNSCNFQNIKGAYALVATLYKHQTELDNLLKRTHFFTKEPRADPWLCKILLVEILWGKKRLPGQSRPENTIRAYEQIFKAHLSDVKIDKHDITDTKGNFFIYRTHYDSNHGKYRMASLTYYQGF